MAQSLALLDFSKNQSTCDWASINSSSSGTGDKDIRDALGYFFKYSDPEHPDAWISCGTDEGPFYILTINRARRTWFGCQICEARYEEYDDQDMNELIEERKLGTFSRTGVFELWQKFISTHLRERHDAKLS